MGDVEQNRLGYRISTDADAMDLDAIHAYLSVSYWCRGIPRDVIAKAIGGSLCFGLFDRERQVGFARVVTDRATFAYLCDVYVFGRPSWSRPGRVVDGSGRSASASSRIAPVRPCDQRRPPPLREVRVCTFGAARNLHGDQSSGNLLAQACGPCLTPRDAGTRDVERERT